MGTDGNYEESKLAKAEEKNEVRSWGDMGKEWDAEDRVPPEDRKSLSSKCVLQTWFRSSRLCVSCFSRRVRLAASAASSLLLFHKLQDNQDKWEGHDASAAINTSATIQPMPSLTRPRAVPVTDFNTLRDMP